MATIDSEQERMLYRVPVGFQLVIYAESSQSAIEIARDEVGGLGDKIHTQISVGTPIELLVSSQIPRVWKGRVPLTDAIDFLEQTVEELLQSCEQG